MLLKSLKLRISARSIGVQGTPLKRTFAHDYLERLHIPIDERTRDKMLETVGVKTPANLIMKAFGRELVNEVEYSVFREELPVLKMKMEGKASLAQQNMSFTGQGFYNTVIPAVVERCVLTNPMWYTAYTPYQAEISQGRLEALFNYQILVKRITKMEMANACLLDEATAAAEAMLMAFRAHNFERKTLLMLNSVYVNTQLVVESTAMEVGIKVVKVDAISDNLVSSLKDDLIGFIGQTPDTYGFLHDYSDVITSVQSVGGLAIIGTDLLACVICKTPGEMGADVAYGNGQRFGTPMGFGGPHAAFFATKMTHLRRLPGRIISVAPDAHGNPAYRLAVQTREQHIRRGIATSNICTSQVLLANLNLFYALYHGEEGLRDIAQSVHNATYALGESLKKNGIDVLQFKAKSPKPFFDTLTIKVKDAKTVCEVLKTRKTSVYMIDDHHISLSIDEVNQHKCKKTLFKNLLAAIGTKQTRSKEGKSKNETERQVALPRAPGPIFKPTDIIHSIQGEHELLRYITRLARKDITLCDSMIPLGSCTMKLNAAFEMQMYGLPALNVHPYVFGKPASAYDGILKGLSQILCQMTGMDGVTYQSNSGATGEYVGLKVIKRYHESRGEGHRNIILIPASAHGTNPASAAKIGLKIIVVNVDTNGYINMDDFIAKVNQHKDALFGLMLTFPSTHGVFEENTVSVIENIHKFGGQVYIDGANMNAQLGNTSPGFVGGDVCHLNLHKTFSIPHGGGGPGMGPVLVKQHLLKHLPKHHESAECAFDSQGNSMKPTGPQTLSSPFGSASILMISYAYARAMGVRGLKNCGTQAVLSANYLAKLLAPHYKVLYTNSSGFVAHEFILDIRPIKAETGITEEDIAKRLMDYNFHAPTMSFPVPGTLMIEPTESESVEELNRFAEALIQIRTEIENVRTGKSDKLNNPLKNAPHTLAHVTGDNWNHPYTREEAAWPLSWLRARGKVWPAVGRIDNANAERNLMFELPFQGKF